MAQPRPNSQSRRVSSRSSRRADLQRSLGKKRRTNVLGRRLHHETLERRELLAAEFTASAMPSFADGTPESVQEQWFDRLNSNADPSTFNLTPQPLGASGHSIPDGAAGLFFDAPNLPGGFARWSNTAHNPDPANASALGDGTTLTWGIVPDGTFVPGEDQDSDLIEFFDGIYGSGATDVVSEKPWFRIFENIYDVWGESTGLNFVYEPSDDSADLASLAAVGELGVRADMRIAGVALDGDFNTLAYNFVPTGGGLAGFDGDMVIDTADIFYQRTANDPTGLNIGLTNVLAHEVGHGLGLAHVLPIAGEQLMEPQISTNFYGPQEDDLWNINVLYGDALEPNDSLGTAVDLGAIDAAAPVIRDVSIDNPDTDTDLYRFELTADGTVDVNVRPQGTQYLVGEQPGPGETVDPPAIVDRLRQSDLAIRILDSDGNEITEASTNPAGVSEFIQGLSLTAGEYYAEVYAASGSFSQAYEISLGASDRVFVGPQLLAIRPDRSDLLEADAVLKTTPSEFNLFFNGGANLDESSINEDTVKLIRAGDDGVLGTADDVEVALGYVGLVQPGDASERNLQQIVLRPASSASSNATDPSFAFPDDLYKIVVVGSGASPLQNLSSEPFAEGNDYEIEFTLDRGAQIIAVVPQPIERMGGTAGSLDQQRDTIEVYFDNQGLNVADAEDESLYQLFNLDDPTAAPLNPLTALYDGDRNLVTLEFAADLAEANYRLDIGEEFVPAGAIVQVMDAAIDDNNSTTTTSEPLGALTADGIRISSQIQPQTVALPPRVGGQDEPGHREIQREAHVGSSGTELTEPEATNIVRYHFPRILGTDSNGVAYRNDITETQKEISRTIFDVYAALSGYEFIEVDAELPTEGLLMIGNGDFRAVSPNLGVNDGVAGLANPSFAMVNGAIYDEATNSYGDGFTNVMMHEIGHSLGLGHSYELPSLMGAPGSLPNDVLPGDHDVVHLRRIVAPNSTDIDMYAFNITDAEGGRFTAETFSQRLATPSSLSTVLTLYRQVGTSVELVARNDRYFGDDSYLSVDLEMGNYFIGVSSSGNDAYNPLVPDSGFGGTTGGDADTADSAYELELSFKPASTRVMTDANGTPIDGDRDGKSGGKHSFYFQAVDSASDTTIFVDRIHNPTGVPVDGEGDGTEANPFDTISDALSKAENRIVLPTNVSAITGSFSVTVSVGGNPIEETFVFGGIVPPPANGTPEALATSIAAAVNARFSPGLAMVNGRTIEFTGVEKLDISGSDDLVRTPNVVRIVGNDADGDLTTTGDKVPYLVGRRVNGSALRDGVEFRVPQGVTAMLDAGVLIKMHQSNLDAGTSSSDKSRVGGAIQVLGTPEIPVYLRSFFDDSFGGNSGAVGQSAGAGDFGGIVLRDDSDLEQFGIFLSSISHADIRHAGGEVFVDAEEGTYTPIFLDDARPTIAFNTIVDSRGGGAVSASPDSFDESGGRIGPEVVGNFLSNNSRNGLFVRIEAGDDGIVPKLSVPGRFNDVDIPHIISQDLIIAGNVGGRFEDAAGNLSARASGRLVIDAGVVVKLDAVRIEAERGGSALIAEGDENSPVIFTSLNDDRYGGSGVFDTSNTPSSIGQAGDWGGLYFGFTSQGSIDNAIISHGGGDRSTTAAGSAGFNAIEIHQADVRVTNTLLSNNADGESVTTRDGRGRNEASVIYVRGAQPILIGNQFVDNDAPAISINANSLNSEALVDRGRATGRVDAFSQFDDNTGPLIRLNQFDNNEINGMVVRGEVLTTGSVWDDTDIVHVLFDEITVQNHHHVSGLTLRSSGSESLVIKLAGVDAGFTASGEYLDIVDRIGGTLTVLGAPGFPVVMTHLSDDSVGAGFSTIGEALVDTDNDGPSSGTPGAWRGLLFDEFSNDRNVAAVRELEAPLTSGKEVNGGIDSAQFLGTLAADAKSGDENRRLGFEVQGFISPDAPIDRDVYVFEGTAGTRVWFDIDNTDPNLDAVVELMNASGTVIARSVNGFDFLDPDNLSPSSLQVGPLTQNLLLGGDTYSTNFRDPGMSLVLPGTAGETGRFFVRVRSAPGGAIAALDGVSSGRYQLQIRLQQVDEFPGSSVRFADIRFATNAIDVQGLPARSLVTGEAGEIQGGGNDTFDTSQSLINLLASDRAVLSIAGILGDEDPNDDENRTDLDVDWYSFDAATLGVQVIEGVNDGSGTVAVVFDLDYADRANRADATVAVFDGSGQLIYVGRESNIEDDRPGGIGGDVSDLSGGTFGSKDAYIGPVHITPGDRYHVAIMGNGVTPSALLQTYQAAPTLPSTQLVRLEPVNSVTRVVEDHIGLVGYDSRGAAIEPTTPAIFDISSEAALANHVAPLDLADVPLFIATDRPVGTSNDQLYLADPFSGGQYTHPVSPNSWSPGNNDIQDITVRSDGRMFGYARLQNNPGQAGQLVEINPTNGALTIVNNGGAPNDGIIGVAVAPNARDLDVGIANPPGPVDDRGTPDDPRIDEFVNSDEVDALTFERVGDLTADPDYNSYFVVRQSDTSSKLYRGDAFGNATPVAASGADPNNAASVKFGLMGSILPAGVTYGTQLISISDTMDPINTTLIRVQSNTPGLAGDFTFTVDRSGNDTAAVITGVDVDARTIDMRWGNNNNGGPTAEAIVNAINNNNNASQLVTAVIYGGSADNGRQGNEGVNAVTEMLTYVGATGDGFAGNVTGITFDDPVEPVNLYGVTLAGEFLEIDKDSGVATLVAQIDDPANPGTPLAFTGLTLGPQHAGGGVYQDMFFAVTNDNRVFAIDEAGVLQSVFDPAAPGGDLSAQMSDIPGNTGDLPIGLVFSPMDVNLWHPTTRRSSDAGHGINAAPDGSRAPEDVPVTFANDVGGDRVFNQDQGGASFYFGLGEWISPDSADDSTEGYLTFAGGPNAQYGFSETLHRDLASNPSIANTYNLPGGAGGALFSNGFSLEGSTSEDRPTLYVNYFLETENHPGQLDNGDDPFRDSARIYVSSDDGVTWNLVATNNSALSDPDPSAAEGQAELPGFISHLSDAGRNADPARDSADQVVQEIFDNTGTWRQLRVDLSDYADEPNVRLRFTFSTAGRLGDEIDSAFGEDANDDTAFRSEQNQFEGFYIDDIIVGYAERGEMITVPEGNEVDSSVFELLTSDRFSDPNPDAFPETLNGAYQIEVRRTGEYAAAGETGIQIGATFDTNDRHIIDLAETGFEDFEGAGPFAQVPVDLTLDGLGTITAAELTPFEASSTRPFQGSASLQSGTIVPGTTDYSFHQLTAADLGSTSDTPGVIEFTFSTSSALDAHGLRFFIDGQPQVISLPHAEEAPTAEELQLASGENAYRTVRYPFSGVNPTFTWLYDGTDPAAPVGTHAAFLDNIRLLQGGTGLLADRNIERQQGVFIIDSNQITSSSNLGIRVGPGAFAAPGVPEPGALINFPQVNTDQLVPGVVIVNNIIAGDSAIEFAGHTDRANNKTIPFGRIINNTLVGLGDGVGVDVVGFASPTLVNNIFFNFDVAIDLEGFNEATTVTRSNYFQRNATIGQIGVGGIAAGDNEPLFVDPVSRNYYLESGSRALDSSIDLLGDRANVITFNTELGIPQSSILAPERDVFGQLRSDSGATGGVGSGVFIDRGAVDRSDEERPYAVLLKPIDNDNANVDIDRSDTVVMLESPILEFFSILLGDGPGENSPFEGTGIDSATVTDQTVIVRQNNVDLVEGVDYIRGFNASTGELRLTPLTTLWQPNSVYEVILDNTTIADRAGNLLRPNQDNGTTQFTIILPTVEFDFGDAPNSFGTAFGSDGARHAIINDGGLRLGRYVDGETDTAGVGTDDIRIPIVVTSASAAFVTSAPVMDVTSFDVVATPAAGDTLSISFGGKSAVFEFVVPGQVAQDGNTPVRMELTDSADVIANKLAASILSQFESDGEAFDLQLTPADPAATPATPATIALTNFDDEDGLQIFDDPANSYFGLFINPEYDAATAASPTEEVLSFLNPNLENGAELSLSVTGSGFIDAWVDFDNDGTFSPGEQVLTSESVVEGDDNRVFLVTPTNVSLPASGVQTRWARFRLSETGNLSPDGIGLGGEVEDIQVTIADVPVPAATDHAYVMFEDSRNADPTNPVLQPIDTLATPDGDTNGTGVGFDTTGFDNVRYVLREDVEFGTLVLDETNGELTYEPDEDFYGQDSFTYQVFATFDLNGSEFPIRSELRTVSITVNPVNDVPFVDPGAFTYADISTNPFVGTEGNAITVTSDDLLGRTPAADLANNESLSQEDEADRDEPWSESEQTESVVQVQVLDENGDYQDIVNLTDASDVFSLEVGDHSLVAHVEVGGSFEPRGTVSVTVAEIVTGQPEITSVTFTPSAVTGTDVDGNDIVTEYFDFNRVNEGPLPFQYTIADDATTTLPDGTDATDQVVRETSTVAHDFSLLPRNDAPDLTADTLTLDEATTDFEILFTTLLDNDWSGPRDTTLDEGDESGGVSDGGLTVLTSGTLVPNTTFSTTAGGTITIDAAGERFVYTPPATDFYGEDSFTYFVTDAGVDVVFETDPDTMVTSEVRSDNFLTASAVVTLNVQPVNDVPAIDAPIASSLDEGASITITKAELIAGVQADGDLDYLDTTVDPAVPFVPQDESNQTFEVVALTAKDMAGNDIVVNAASYTADNAAIYRATYGTFTVVFNDTGAAITQDGSVIEDGGLISLIYTPDADFNSTDYQNAVPEDLIEVIPYVIEDDGLAIDVFADDPDTATPIQTTKERIDTTLRITVNAVNDLPTMDPIADQATIEDSGVRSVTITGITPGGVLRDGSTAVANLEPQIVRLSATSSNTGLISTLSFTTSEFTFDAANDVEVSSVLNYTPNDDRYGRTTITVTYLDAGANGIFGDGDDATNSQTFDVYVEPINDTPSVGVQDRSVAEDGSITITKSELINTAFGALPADMSAPAPEDESGQLFEVTTLVAKDAAGNDVDVTVADFTADPAAVYRASYGSFTVTFNDTGAPIDVGGLEIKDGGLIELVYRPDADFNSTDYQNAVPEDLIDVIAFTITDDGLQTDVADGGADLVTPALTTSSEIRLTVTPELDVPTVLAFDTLTPEVEVATDITIPISDITPGGIERIVAEHVARYEPQDVRLSVAIGNPGLFTAAVFDQAAFTFDATVTEPFTTDLTLTQVADRYGRSQITITIEDNGPDGLFDGPNGEPDDNSVTTLVINVDVTPTNDVPVVGDIALTDLVEDTSRTITRAELLASASASDLDPAIVPPPEDESNQGLDVIRILAFDSSGAPVDVTAATSIDGGGALQTFATPFGSFTAEFNQTGVPVNVGGADIRPGGLIQINYSPDDDFNSEDFAADFAPGSLLDSLQFEVADDGLAVDVITPGNPDIVMMPESAIATLTLSIGAVDDVPTLDDFVDRVGAMQLFEIEGIGLQTIPVTGINPGGQDRTTADHLARFEPQQVRLSVEVDDDQLITEVMLTETDFTFDATTLAEFATSFTFQPLEDRYGQAVVTVTIEDAGIDGDFTTTGDNLTSSQDITIVIEPVNDVPTTQPKTLTLFEDQGRDLPLNPYVVTAAELTSLSLGAVAGDMQAIAPQDESNQNAGPFFLVGLNNLAGVSITDPASSAANLPLRLTHGSITNVNFDAMGDIVDFTYLPDADFYNSIGGIDLLGSPFSPASPMAETFGFTIEDSGIIIDNLIGGPRQIERQATSSLVTLRVDAVNDNPTLDPLPDLVFNENNDGNGPITVDLSGITRGALNENERVRVRTLSSNPVLFRNPSDTYTSPSPTGTISLELDEDRYGTSLVTVTIEDGGLDDNFFTTADNRSFSQDFLVTVNPVNDEPVAFGRRYNLIEGPGNTVRVTKDDLLEDALADSRSSQPSPFNEAIQTIRVSELIIDGDSVTSSGVFSTPYGDVDVTFDNGEVLEFTYDPGDDFNADNPRDGGVRRLDFIDFVVSDDGATTGLDGTSAAPNLPEQSTTRRVEFFVTPSNDAPVLGMDTIAATEDVVRLITQDELLGNDVAGPPDEQNGTNDDPLTITRQTVVSAEGAIVDFLPDGTLRYTPIPNFSGVDTFFYDVTDNGILEDTDGSRTEAPITSRGTVMVNVQSVNDDPTLDSLSPVTMFEDPSTPRIVGLGGLSAGGGETQDLRVVATSDTPSLFANPILNTIVTDANVQTTLLLTPEPDQFGTATITVTVSDAGEDGVFDTADDSAEITRSFIVRVRPVNDDPTVDPIADLDLSEFDEGDPAASVDILGISPGSGEADQPLQVVVTSDNPTLIPESGIVTSYESPSDAGSVTITPAADRSGEAVVTVTVIDGGLDLDLSTTEDNGETTTSFTVRVAEVNDVPTIDAIADQPVDEGAASYDVDLTGVSAGINEPGNVTIVATSDNVALIPDPIVSNNNDGTATLSFTTDADSNGTANITVTVTDVEGESTTQTFAIAVAPVNDAPEIAPIANATATEGDAEQTISFSGVNAGGGETEVLTVTAATDNADLITGLGVNYTSPDGEGTIVFTPGPNQNGTATITVTVEDAGGETTQTSFTVTVDPVNVDPTIDPVGPVASTEDGDQQRIVLNGITAGPNESQEIAVTAVAGVPAKVAIVDQTYTSPNQFGVIEFLPVADQFGETTIVVTVTDGGDDGLLSTTEDNASIEQTITINLSAQNDAPSLGPIENQAIDEGSGQLSVALGGISSGPGESGDLRFTTSSSNPDLVSNATVIHVDGESTGTVTLSPNDFAFGTAVISVTVEDPGQDGDFSTTGDNLRMTQTFVVEVAPVNDPPMAVDDTAMTDEDLVLEIEESQLVANDIDPDVPADVTQSLSIILDESNPTGMQSLTTSLGASVTFDPATGILIYDPTGAANLQALSPGQTATDSFVYSLTDSVTPGDLTQATVTLTVSGLNDAPVVVDDLVSAPDLPSDPSTLDPIIILPLANDFDIDGTLDLDSLIVTEEPQFGSIAKRTVTDADGNDRVELAYTPFNTFTGGDEFAYTVSDNLGQQSAQANVTIQPNQAPVSGADMGGGVPSDGIRVNVLANDRAVAGELDLSTLTIVTAPENGVATVQDDGSISYEPNEDYFGPDSFTYTITDTEGNTSAPTRVNVNAVRSGRQNAIRFQDVNANGEITALDALLIVNRLTRAGSGMVMVEPDERGPEFFDVNGSQTITALDALLVINHIGTEAPIFEGESLSPVIEVSGSRATELVLPLNASSSRDSSLAVGETASEWVPLTQEVPTSKLVSVAVAELFAEDDSEDWLDTLADDTRGESSSEETLDLLFRTLR